MQATILERAFELARSGEFRTLADIERKLRAERHEGIHSSLASPSLRKQLRQLCLDHRTAVGRVTD